MSAQLLLELVKNRWHKLTEVQQHNNKPLLTTGYAKG